MLKWNEAGCEAGNVRLKVIDQKIMPAAKRPERLAMV